MTYVAPGGTVAERWKDGHAAAALRGGKWDVLVLQERGGLLACLVDAEQRSQSECRASERAHKQFAELASAAARARCCWRPGARTRPGNSSSIARSSNWHAQRRGVVPAGRTCAPTRAAPAVSDIPTACSQPAGD